MNIAYLLKKIAFLALSIGFFTSGLDAKFINQGGIWHLGRFFISGYFTLSDCSMNANGVPFSRGTEVRGALIESVLNDALLTDLDMCGVAFNGCDLSGSDFSRTELNDATFTYSNVLGTNFERAIGLTPAQKANLKKRGAVV